ncbi:hypothetical protein DAPPUDRAFT_250643 [Daphnia pulex]|uniref:Uncharacterized protein n=1 Tax=Daphnia pulex TaxID=6669 RepID=E9GZ09_DAPPU|nr:hypothetical protein DAPPUDRAFT_250643 [Daphnia pulex]|eukprot:EFX75313.1 hypothetical protein DAPPUDRAFT_250643 [Daphnia pulex]
MASFRYDRELTKLTLAHLKVDVLDFISTILSKCLKLKSLRLTKIISDHMLVSDVVTQIKKGIPEAKNLEDFRWELGNDEFFNKSDPSTKKSEDYPLIGPEYYVGESTAEAISKVSASHANEMIIFESQIAKLPLC